MKISDVSIRRPVFTTMVMTAIVVFGVVMYRALPVDMFPNVDFPIVTVTAIFPGADPETMETKVAEPIEEAVNSLRGIKSLRSVSLEGVALVYIEFDLDVPLDAAAQDVRDRIAGIQRDLPDGVEPPTVEKLDLGAAAILSIAVSREGDPIGLANYVEDVVKPRLERVDGVGRLEIVGGREREVHVWLNPERLRALGFTVGDVSNALAAQNVDVPGGRVTTAGQEFVVRTDAEVPDAESLADVALATRNGMTVRLGDVATVEFGLEEERSRASLNREPAIAVQVQKQSGTNTVAVADGVRAAIEELQAAAPEGTTFNIVLDNSTKIRGSLDAVRLDLLLGAALAVAIIFFFLRDPAATFISALALPTSVLGTFMFVKVAGFSLNIMTTLALSLSIGILIDDAIVVIENIVRRRTELKESPIVAAQRGTSEIGLAVLATTFSIVAVFVPVAFMEGMIGKFFFEFGLTVAAAVLISLFVSFTMTPMLSARLLSEHHGEPRGLSGAIEWLLRSIESLYRATIRGALRYWPVVIVLSLVSLFGAMRFSAGLGFEFLPAQDSAQFQVNVELPTGTSLDRTAEYVDELEARIAALPHVTTTFASIGGGVQERVNTASVIVKLTPRHDRTLGQADLMNLVREVLAERPDVVGAVAEVEDVSTGQATQPIQLNLRGDDLASLARAADVLVAELRQREGYVDVDTSFRGGRPQIDVDLDPARAADMGIMGAQAGLTVRSLVAGDVATQLQTATDRVDVRVQLPPELRTSVDVLRDAQLRTPSGALVDLATVADIRESSGPTQIDREARQRQVTVLANLDGKVLGDAIQEVRQLAEERTPPGMTAVFGGRSQMLEETQHNMAVAMILAVLCIYLILASQFESFVHPFTIMVSLPFSFIGAFGALVLSGLSMSIYGMIGLIMLMGLVTKNAILIIDRIIQLREGGESIKAAIEEAGAVRLRPILMTTAAMMVGMVPVAIGHGEGGEARAPMGIAIIGGLATSTLLTLVVVPVIYMLIEGITSALAALVRRVRRLFGAREHVTEEAPAG